MHIDDPAGLYDHTRSEAIGLFRSLDEEQAAAAVPLTPGWSVADVAAHVCGINGDIVTGNLGGLGTDEWTQAQVESRRDRTIGEICDEWESYAERVGELIGADVFFGVRLTGDLIVHVHDVHHALGMESDRASLATRAGAYRYVAHLQDRVKDRLDIGIEVELTDGETYASPGAETYLRLRTSSYDYLRSVTGRRSRRQVEALEWSGDPTAVLDNAWNSYGTFPNEDVIDEQDPVDGAR